MFAGLAHIAPHFRRQVVALLAIWAALQLSGVAIGPVMTQGASRIPEFSRLGGSVALILCAAALTAGAPRAVRGSAALTLLGIVFGALGDFSMAKIIPTPNSWIAGMVFFGLGHLWYLGAFVRQGGALGLPRSGVRPGIVALVIAAILALWLGAIASDQQGALMRHAGLAYALVIATMMGVAASLATQERRLMPLAVGAALFLLSDVMLGDSAFRHSRGALWNDTIWVEYTVGQALIVLSPIQLAAALAGRREAAPADSGVMA